MKERFIAWIKPKVTISNIVFVLIMIYVIVFMIQESGKPTKAESRGYSDQEEEVLRKVQRSLLDQ